MSLIRFRISDLIVFISLSICLHKHYSKVRFFNRAVLYVALTFYNILMQEKCHATANMKPYNTKFEKVNYNDCFTEKTFISEMERVANVVWRSYITPVKVWDTVVTLKGNLMWFQKAFKRRSLIDTWVRRSVKPASQS